MSDPETVAALKALTESNNRMAVETASFNATVSGEIKLMQEQLTTINDRGSKAGYKNIATLRSELQASDQILHTRVDDAVIKASKENKDTNKRFDMVKNFAIIGAMISSAVGAIGGYIGFKH